MWVCVVLPLPKHTHALRNYYNGSRYQHIVSYACRSHVKNASRRTTKKEWEPCRIGVWTHSGCAGWNWMCDAAGLRVWIEQGALRTTYCMRFVCLCVAIAWVNHYNQRATQRLSRSEIDYVCMLRTERWLRSPQGGKCGRKRKRMVSMGLCGWRVGGKYYSRVANCGLKCKQRSRLWQLKT